MNDKWFNAVFDLMAQIVITIYSKEKSDSYHNTLTDSTDINENRQEL